MRNLIDCDPNEPVKDGEEFDLTGIYVDWASVNPYNQIVKDLKTMSDELQPNTSPIDWNLRDILQSLDRKTVQIRERFHLENRMLDVSVLGLFHYQPPESCGPCSVQIQGPMCKGILSLFHEDILSVEFGGEQPTINLRKPTS